MRPDIINPILQAADQQIQLTVTDSSGAAYDMSSASKLIVAVYYEDGTLLQKYSKNSAAGWSVLDVTSASSGILKFKIETGDTITAPPGKVFAEVRIQTADVSYEDGYYDLLGQGIYIGEIVQSITSTLTLP